MARRYFSAAPKERVAELMADGLEPKDIAERLGVARTLIYKRIMEIKADIGWH